MEQQQQQQLEQQAIALAMEQQKVMEQQQQQQQQKWNSEMSQASYVTVPTDANFQSGQADTSQFYNGQADGGAKDGGASLGVYTPDSSTNSVHSLHGYPENHDNYPVGGGDGGGGDMTSDQAGQYTQDMSGQAGLDNSYTQVENTDPVHNTSVMESPSSIGSVEIPQAYSDQTQSCAQTPMTRTVHPAAISNNSPSNPGQLHPAAIQGSSPGNPPTSNQSPHNSSINQSPSAAIHNNITNQSPHHTTPISQSPHPIQSPHPPMQPSPHNQQSSPHPPIINSQITSPYTNLPHQSPTGSVGYVAPPQPQQRQSSSSGHTSKSPRAPSSRSSQQQ